jgi:L-amino acid N-acyltransferase YncA
MHKGEEMIRPATRGDAEAICNIYNFYVLNTSITFEEHPVNVEDMTNRIDAVQVKLPWLVFENDGTVKGFSFATEWKGRSAYRYTAESTIYLSQSCAGKGIGFTLYDALLTDLRQRALHSVIGGIALPNQASIALHERLGFQKVAHFNEVGFKFGTWIDVAYWQKSL